MNFFIKATPYNFKLFFTITEDKAEAAAYITKVFRETTADELKDSYAKLFYDDENNVSPALWLRFPPTTPKQYGEFIHEVYHGCIEIGKGVGMSLEELTGETFAYFIESVAVKALTKIEKIRTTPEPEELFSKN
jgi:hypothetical protein